MSNIKILFYVKTGHDPISVKNHLTFSIYSASNLTRPDLAGPTNSYKVGLQIYIDNQSGSHYCTGWHKG